MYSTFYFTQHIIDISSRNLSLWQITQLIFKTATLQIYLTGPSQSLSNQPVNHPLEPSSDPLISFSLPDMFTEQVQMNGQLTVEEVNADVFLKRQNNSD
jgi:hypothetical protein